MAIMLCAYVTGSPFQIAVREGLPTLRFCWHWTKPVEIRSLAFRRSTAGRTDAASARTRFMWNE